MIVCSVSKIEIRREFLYRSSSIENLSAYSKNRSSESHINNGDKTQVKKEKRENNTLFRHSECLTVPDNRIPLY